MARTDDEDVAWYAVRTSPGSQKPQREFVIEKTSSIKGYRVVPSLNPHVSAVELALSKAGFTYYMPAEKRLQRDRRRPYLWKSRRFALMVGYIFVRGPVDWRKLKETPGVAGVVEDQFGNARKMHLAEMLLIRSAEGDAEAFFDDDLRAARKGLRKAAKKMPELQKLVDELDIAGTISVQMEEIAG